MVTPCYLLSSEDFELGITDEKKNTCVCLSRSELLHLIQSFLGSSIYLQISWFHLSLYLNNNPSCTFITFSLSVN